jgi:hypothetical protein
MHNPKTSFLDFKTQILRPFGPQNDKRYPICHPERQRRIQVYFNFFVYMKLSAREATGWRFLAIDESCAQVRAVPGTTGIDNTGLFRYFKSASSFYSQKPFSYKYLGVLETLKEHSCLFSQIYFLHLPRYWE